VLTGDGELASHIRPIWIEEGPPGAAG
jgi:hypothetical protein